MSLLNKHINTEIELPDFCTFKDGTLWIHKVGGYHIIENELLELLKCDMVRFKKGNNYTSVTITPGDYNDFDVILEDVYGVIYGVPKERVSKIHLQDWAEKLIETYNKIPSYFKYAETQ